MNADQFERWLRRQGIEVEPKGSSGHVILRNPSTGATSELPRHGGRKQLGKGLVRKIMKDLGLD
ncbi:type II toxin-antitoxin system HicA family toxin [uncultured Rhodospira sp.]|uniref:type II toxin-antitoxin system HicA family toxin n=1 Tax=uncultured Rhodospira sp. TaxID=1936189 RepID=UPI003457D255